MLINTHTQKWGEEATAVSELPHPSGSPTYSTEKNSTEKHKDTRIIPLSFPNNLQNDFHKVTSPFSSSMSPFIK